MAAEFDIAVGVLNRAEIKKLEKDVDDLEKKIVDVGEAFEKKRIDVDAFNASIRVNGQQIAEARTKIQALAEENMRLGESIESGANPSMRTAIRVMDQLAMGSEGLIRSIPSLAAQFGAGAELTLGLAATALAIDMLAKHWQDLQDAFGHTSGIEDAKTALERFGETLGSIASYTGIAGEDVSLVTGMFERIGRRRELRAVEAKQAAGGRGAVERAVPEEEKERGTLFQKALDEYRGWKLVEDMMATKYGSKTLTEGQREFAREEIFRQINRAKEGEITPAEYRGIFGEKFLDVWGKAFEKREKPAIERLDKEFAEEEKRLDKEMGQAALKEWDDMIKEMEAGIRATTKHQIEQLEDQRTTLERQKRDMHRDVRGAIYTSGEEMTRATQLGVLNDIPKRRLKLAEELNKKIDEVNNNITRLRRGAVFQ